MGIALNKYQMKGFNFIISTIDIEKIVHLNKSFISKCLFLLERQLWYCPCHYDWTSWPLNIIIWSYGGRPTNNLLASIRYWRDILYYDRWLDKGRLSILLSLILSLIGFHVYRLDNPMSVRYHWIASFWRSVGCIVGSTSSSLQLFYLSKVSAMPIGESFSVNWNLANQLDVIWAELVIDRKSAPKQKN